MSSPTSLRKDLAKSLLHSLLAVFLIPVITFSFILYADYQLDKKVTQRVYTGRVSEAQKHAELSFWRANPPSKLCGSTLPELQAKRQANCQPFSDLWQFHVIKKTTQWTLIGSTAVFMLLLLSGATAFINRGMRYLSFQIGWRLLTLTAVAGTLVQGVMLIWLSYWLTAYFTNRYFPKLMGWVGILVLIGVVVVIKGIFKKLPPDDEIHGKPITRLDAPGLWTRVEKMAMHLNTTPPEHIIAGIDTNFFVTEAPLTIAGKVHQGRSLFVSLPLLRILNTEEADSVLAHELAHFKGGDTASGATLGPKLMQFSRYTYMLYENVSTKLFFHLFMFYRLVFEFALQKDSREQEFRADRLAAQLISPQAIINSLIKIKAFAAYRAQVEENLYEQDKRHDKTLGIVQSVEAGLKIYAHSEVFLDDINAGEVPHPFDSHPPLAERMANVGYVVDEEDFSSIVAEEPQKTWLEIIDTGEAVEQALWGEYEKSFSEDHEHSLAYRYKPATPEETELVLKYFPTEIFELKKAQRVQIDYTGIIAPEGDSISWDMVESINYEEGTLSDTLTITLPEKKMIGNKTFKIKLPGIKNERERFKGVFGAYWERYRIMQHYRNQ